MKQVKIDKIKLKDIKHIENSRIRDKDDVADLMQDIEQRGLLQKIAIRLDDNALIFGNRRVRAYENLGYEEIEAEFYTDISDEDLLVINLVENIKRRNIGSIEIGRICNMLRDKGLTNTEIAQKLAISKGRVQSCVAAYNITINTPFENLIFSNSRGKRKGIPESLIWRIQNSLTRARKLNKNDWNLILRAIEKDEFKAEHISQLRKILLSSPDMPMVRALELLGKCKVFHMYFYFDERKLVECMGKEKFDNCSEFIKFLIKKYDKDLIF